MIGRVRDLYYEYCVPKPKFSFQLWDTQCSTFPDEDTPQAQTERESIDIYVHLVT